MDNSIPPHQEPLEALDDLRSRIPELHPYTALILTLDPMALRGEITSETYLRWSAMLVSSQGKALFSEN
jgi:hypothetical protein